MSDTVDTLNLGLLEWMGPKGAPYAEVMDAWQTSCRRLAVREDANDRGFIGVIMRTDVARSVPAAGSEHLRKRRQPSPR